MSECQKCVEVAGSPIWTESREGAKKFATREEAQALGGKLVEMLGDQWVVTSRDMAGRKLFLLPAGCVRAEVSLLPLDVGFDLREQQQIVRLARASSVRYLDEGQERVVTGCPETIAETLARAGYSVVVATTRNGRDVQCSRQEAAPAGEQPGHEWQGPAWAVQAKVDNYWCVAPSLAAALDRAGWKPSEIEWLTEGDGTAAAQQREATVLVAADEENGCETCWELLREAVPDFPLCPDGEFEIPVEAFRLVRYCIHNPPEFAPSILRRVEPADSAKGACHLAYHMGLSGAGPVRYLLVPAGLEDFRGVRQFDCVGERGQRLPPLFTSRYHLCALRLAVSPDGAECPQERVLVNTLRALASGAKNALPEIVTTRTLPAWAGFQDDQRQPTCTWLDSSTQEQCGKPAVERIANDAACEKHRHDSTWQARMAAAALEKFGRLLVNLPGGDALPDVPDIPDSM